MNKNINNKNELMKNIKSKIKSYLMCDGKLPL